MQTIANENVQSLANYANKSAAYMNAIKTLKGQIIDIKETQTAANKKNPTSQAKLEIRGNIIPATIFDKKDGIIKEDINTKAIITNKGVEEAEEI